jgi:hypothetical protein
MREDPVTLVTLANGAAMELFDSELSKVVENILDPNTLPDTVRKVILMEPRERLRRYREAQQTGDGN